MDYTYQPKQSNKRMVAVAAVLALHVFIVYALVTGLARKAVEVIKKPIEAKIVEEVKHRPRLRTCRLRRLLRRRHRTCRRSKSPWPLRPHLLSPRLQSRPKPNTRSLRPYRQHPLRLPRRWWPRPHRRPSRRLRELASARCRKLAVLSRPLRAT